MRILKKGYSCISIKSSPRLCSLYKHYSVVSVELGNTWFNKNKKLRLRKHLDVVSKHQDWLVLRSNSSVVASVGVERVFGSKMSFKTLVIVKFSEVGG